jgi:hypothetical protein
MTVGVFMIVSDVKKAHEVGDLLLRASLLTYLCC